MVIFAVAARLASSGQRDAMTSVAHQNASLTVAPPEIAEALQVALALPADDPGRVVAQREIVASLEAALDARRHRIIISSSTVNPAKWAGVIALAVLTLIANACVHCANRRTMGIALTLSHPRSWWPC